MEGLGCVKKTVGQMECDQYFKMKYVTIERFTVIFFNLSVSQSQSVSRDRPITDYSFDDYTSVVMVMSLSMAYCWSLISTGIVIGRVPILPADSNK